MPISVNRSCLAVLRSVAGITQKELARLIDCATVTVQSIELGKLALSRRLAERVSLQTGVSLEWLLKGDFKSAPISARDPQPPLPAPSSPAGGLK